MAVAITEEQLALAESVRAWAARHEPVAAVRAREHDPAAGDELAAGLAGLGLYGVALPERLGGAGGQVTDLVAGLAEAATALVPGPVAGRLLAGLVLAAVPDTPVAGTLGPALAAGEARAAVALPARPARAVEADGGLVVHGSLGPVPDAEPDAHLVAPVDAEGRREWVVLEPGTGGVRFERAEPLDFSRSLAHVELAGARVPAGAVLTGLTGHTVTDLAVTLAAAEAAGVAAWCVRTAAEYAKVREQFGRPIGAFQAVKHLCAEMLCRAEQAAALAWDAARAAGEPGGQHALAAAAAGAGALDAAVDNAKDCVQVLGGTGFTWEHDAHLYLRRAVATRQLLGGGARWRRRAAELARSGARREHELDLTGYTGEETTRRVRAVAEEIAALPADRQRARLADTGYLVPHWPRPYGLAASPAEQLVIEAELARAGVRRPDLVVGGWAAPTILGYGTPGQRDRFVGPTLRGELTWCQLFSEPGAGSDLAALRTKASRVDGGWLLTGQKVWTSLAHSADWGICLARTDSQAPKHKGITYFLVDMRSAGIEARPLREITGDAVFNEVFLADVFVPDDCVVGEVNGGWRIARATLANERVALGGGSSLGEGLEALLTAEAEPGPAELERLGALVATGSACSALGVRATLRALGGQDPGPESSVRKLAGVRQRQAVAEAALDALGPAGAVAGGAEQHEFLLSRCLSIAGGTTQVLLNVTAERLLGLPRD